MSVFVDTSFLYACMDAGDPNHAVAAALAPEHLEGALTHSFVMVETLALVDNRAGRAVARRVVTDVLPSLDVVDVTSEVRARALAAFTTAPARYSFVDLVSFEVARERAITQVLAFDDDFKEMGFDVIGGSQG